MIQNTFLCKTVDEISIGDRAEVKYTITDDELRKFGEISGDWNFVHFDPVNASKTIFKERISHGLISLAKFSGIFGMLLPGQGTLWETQEVRFIAPVYLNKEYAAVAEVTGKAGRRVTLAVWVEDERKKRVIEGTAVVIPITENMRKKLALHQPT
jgi:3-hydroxybutyryl-CoA dehydratase